MTLCFACLKELDLSKDVFVILGQLHNINSIVWCKTCYLNGLYDRQKEKIENYIKAK